MNATPQPKTPLAHDRKEMGYSAATTSNGITYNFAPTLGRMANLGTRDDIEGLLSDLDRYDAKAIEAAGYILTTCCTKEDGTALFGHMGQTKRGRLVWEKGAMSAAEMVFLAKHLMLKGTLGQTGPGAINQPVQASVRTFDPIAALACVAQALDITTEQARDLTMAEYEAKIREKGGLQ